MMGAHCSSSIPLLGFIVTEKRKTVHFLSRLQRSPWAAPTLTWIHRRCSSRVGPVRPRVLSTADTDISQHPGR